MFWKALIFLFILYMVLRFFVKYIAPIVRLTNDTRQRLNEMQHQMNQRPEPRQEPKRKDGEFIDYEEVK